MMQVHFRLSMTCTWVNDMPKGSRYTIAKCCIEKSCPKCFYIGDAIVINKGTHHTLYCEKCGAYIKHASVEDKFHTYVAHVKVEDGTPMKVAMHYIESEKTAIVKLK